MNEPRSFKDAWVDFKATVATWLFFAFIASPIVGPVIGGLIYVPLYRASLSAVNFTVDRRERVVTGSGDSIRAYYLVWSREGEVFCVTDTWSFMTFDSSDRYGKLVEGSIIHGKAAGWRVPFLSWYRNVVAIDSVSSSP